MAEGVSPPNDDQLAENSPVDPRLKSGTYVVQVPKDQIYRVPPPENAILAERYLQPVHQHNPLRRLCFRVLIILGGLIFVLVIASAIFFVVVTPTAPSFQIEGLKVKNHAKPEFDLTLTTRNPNAQIGIEYQQGGRATLFYNEDKKIATGRPPTLLDVGPKESAEFEVSLKSSKVSLPSDIKKSLKNPKSKAKIPLSVSMILPLKAKVAGLKKADMDVNVRCDLVVTKLTKATRIVRQKCETKM